MNTTGKFILSIAGSAMLAFTAWAQDVNQDLYVGEATAQAQEFVKTAVRTGGSYPDFSRAAESTVNSVVSIKNYGTSRQQQIFGGSDDWDPFEFFFGPGWGGNGGQQRKQQQPKGESKPQLRGSGSGVIISEDGYIVTNNHVVDGAEKLTVTLNDNSEYNARVIGTDATTDLALIKISTNDLHPITFGNSDDVKVGEWALAVGNPFGLNSTVTAGIISAKGRGVSENSSVGIKTFIQHDAAVNPGNSGGALVNTDGELIGINTMIFSQTGNYAGLSFAVPSNIVKKIITDIKQYGTVQRAVLGIQYKELDAESAKEHGITATKEGIYVAKVNDLSAAKEAGLQEGDVIVKLNGASVKNSGEMQEEMNKLRPGDKAALSYYRDNKLRSTTVTSRTTRVRPRSPRAATAPRWAAPSRNSLPRRRIT
ncbi:MAG: trypsin-like peptidase domain-containing protein [Muribaculaceae bacterium]|nr:trypsin-like peptidase domain-containing protein [Muribaculaceae bacterium]